MAESYKICPICQTANHQNAQVCTTCGTDLVNVEAVTRIKKKNPAAVDYDFRYGETDLLEHTVGDAARRFTGVLLLLLIGALGGGVFILQQGGFFDAQAGAALDVAQTPSPRPTLNVATVTLGPPTATYTLTPPPTFTPSLTPTRGPCVITLPAGQNLTWAVANCGHRDLDVMPTVLALNDIDNPAAVQAGQQIQIPWPTPTPDPNAIPTDPPAQDSDDAGEDTLANSSVLSVNESIVAFAATPTPTLPPGVQWHQVQPEENIAVIINIYNADVKTLSELNREIDFARCDFGYTYGGPECIVQLRQGQMVRVPAPTPLPTATPTLDPNATATPTATPIFNRPRAGSPEDRAFFYADTLITLRWIPSATLAAGETYRVDVTDLTANIAHVAYTRDIVFTLPLDWRGTQAERHDFQWQVSIVDEDTPAEVRYPTEPRTFVWQGIVEDN